MSGLPALPARAALAAVVLVSGMVAAGAVGWHLGARQATKSLSAALSAPGIGAATSDSQADTATLTRERDTALASIATLQDRLVEAERRQAVDAADLALYRRLGEQATDSGLGIDTVVWHKGDGAAVLDITLVQAKGRHRVSGTLGVSVPDGPEAGQDRVLVPDTGERAVPFDLRFFQTLSVPVDASIADAPPSGGLAISVRPDGERHPDFVDIRARDAIIMAAPGE